MELHRGDAYEVLKGLPDCSVDSCVTDPPAGIAFMGKDWDRDKGGRNDWTDWLTDVMEQVYRVLKPGGHALVWAIPRTSHWTAWAVEDAGFEIRDVVTHHFGTGFPKSLDIGKAIDKAAGKEREVIGHRDIAYPDSDCWSTPNLNSDSENRGGAVRYSPKGTAKGGKRPITGPATDDAARWEGFGTALKPASEHWVLARKPLTGTVAANVLEHGTGALNIDGCRISSAEPSPAAARRASSRKTGNAPMSGKLAEESNAEGKIGRRGSAEVYMQERPSEQLGRWPANLVLSHSPDCVEVGTREVKAHGSVSGDEPSSQTKNTYGDASPRKSFEAHGKGGKEEVPAWECAPGCPVAELDQQSGELRPRGNRNPSISGGGTGNSVTPGPPFVSEHHAREELHQGGGASRFFYTAKASKRERGEGNDHPTVKPLALMRWLVRLVTPPGGTVLDPFMGSGTTGMAAKEEGFEFVGVELDKHYYDLAQRRVGAVQGS